jgi:hypothetical protein
MTPVFMCCDNVTNRHIHKVTQIDVSKMLEVVENIVGLEYVKKIFNLFATFQNYVKNFVLNPPPPFYLYCRNIPVTEG